MIFRHWKGTGRAFYCSSASGEPSLLDITRGRKEPWSLLPYHHHWQDQIIEVLKKLGEVTYFQKKEKKGMQRQKMFKDGKKMLPLANHIRNRTQKSFTQLVVVKLRVCCRRGDHSLGWRARG